MKTTFIQSLRDKLSEIFHPRDFRKLTRCSCQKNNRSCTDNACTENESNFGHNYNPDCLITSESRSFQKQSPVLEHVEGNSKESTSADNEVAQSKTTIANDQTKNISSEDPSLTENSPKSYKTLSESISMIKSESQPTSPSFNEGTTSEQSSVETTSTENETNDNELNCINPERQLLLQRILIKILIICILALLTLLIPVASRANDHQSMASLSVGVLYPNGLDISAQYERSTSYHNAWAVEINGYQRWRNCPDCCKVCTQSFWDFYHSYHLGLVYKPCVYRTRNQHGRLRLGASIGYDNKHVLGGVLLGYEQTYCLLYGCELFWTAKMDIHALAKSWVRPGLSIGLRLPI